jgi:hypothetical protein
MTPCAKELHLLFPQNAITYQICYGAGDQALKPEATQVYSMVKLLYDSIQCHELY